ncbi:MAG: cohesin domain-containing protein, partial [Eubacteriales bacterium]
MKRIKILVALSAFIIATIIPVAVFASSVSVEADATRFYLGETVTVTITVSGEDMAVVQGTYDYDYNVLSYASSTGGAADGQLNMVSMQSGGASSMTAVIEFTAIGNGDITIDVAIDEILDYDGDALSPCAGSVDISVVSSNSLPIEGNQETIPPFVLDGIPAENVYGTDADLFVWRSVLNLTLPSGFSDTQVSYGGESVGGAISNGDSGTVLLYLSDVAGEKAAFYAYDEESGALHPFITTR